MSIEELGGVEGPIFFGPDLQLGLSAEIWNFGLEPGLPAGPGRAARPNPARDLPNYVRKSTNSSTP